MLKPLLIEATEFTPKVWLEPQYNLMEISGYSRPENVASVYFPVIQYLHDYERHVIGSPSFKPGTELNLQFKLKYFNSASSKFIVDILDLLIGFQSKGLNLRVEWFYDSGDETIYEAGQDMAEIADFQFHFIEIKN